jgi:hypothetical protein
VRLAALVGYVLLALAFTWPLLLHLDTHLTGPIGGDTGVYVWNQWLFRHEVLNQHLPLFTREIFSFTRPANLSLHNYTIFQDLLALPLLGTLGIVTTFNVVYLLMIVITGYATFRLVCHVTQRPLEAWLAGALFSWSPYLATRGTGHFSLVAAAPLPVFVLLLLKCDERPSVRNAVALGATVCWAATTDPYYAVYCVMLACVFVAVQAIRFARDPLRCPVPRTIDVLLASVAGFALSSSAAAGSYRSLADTSARTASTHRCCCSRSLGCCARRGHTVVQPSRSIACGSCGSLAPPRWLCRYRR